MASFSNLNPFQPLKRYVSVRLQQGVPLVDADWNEKDDIRRFELQAFLKWFIGNGVPANSNAFLIRARQTGTDDGGNPIYASDDFIISGVGINPDLENPTPADYLNSGRCLVEGQDVFITDDIDFKQQPLYQGNTPGESEIIDPDRSRAPVILPIPTTTEPLIVYLDVWEWQVEEEDRDLFNQVIGMRTCLRKRRDWAVRVDTEIPSSDENHSYFHLATLSHGAPESIIPSNITDTRQTLSLSILRNNLESLSDAVANAQQRIIGVEGRITNTEQRITDTEGRVTSAEQRLTPLEEIYLLPAIDNVSPRRGPPGQEVTFTGRNFQLQTTRPIVFFEQNVAEIVGAPTNTSLVARVPTMSPGRISVSIETPYGTAPTAIQFEVEAP